MGKNNAKIYDWQTALQIGIDPKTKAPMRGDGKGLFEIRKAIRIMDEQDAVNRFTWYNLPAGIDQNLLERMLYYRGQLVLFFHPNVGEDGEFFILPYTLASGDEKGAAIDAYGRFKKIKPLPFNGVSEEEAANGRSVWLTDQIREVQYEVVDEEEWDESLIDTKAVILRDYTPQIGEVSIARCVLNEPLVSAMAEAYPMARTSLIAHSGIKGVRVNSEDESMQVQLASRGVYDAAMTGDPWVPMLGNQEFQELTEEGGTSPQDYLLYMQSLDNFRLSLYGLQQGGIFEKNNKLKDEQALNSGNSSIVMEDALRCRQRFCDIVNSIFDLGIWCEISESAQDADMDMDGTLVEGEANQAPMEGGANDE